MGMTCWDEPSPQRVSRDKGLREDSKLCARRARFRYQLAGFADGGVAIQKDWTCLNGSDLEQVVHSTTPI